MSNTKPTLPIVSWQPLKEVKVVDRGLAADPEKKSLLSAASEIITITPTIGTEVTELHGIDLRRLSDKQKDELCLQPVVAGRGVDDVHCQFSAWMSTDSTQVFQNQERNIQEQINLGRHWGPLHRHSITGIPQEPGLEEVHVVYSDSLHRPDPTVTFAKRWHTDASYELQTPSTTSLKMFTGPETGGDTLRSSGVVEVARAAGPHLRRAPIETTHPVVRVHPVTGWKSVYVNPGWTLRIVGVPRAESDAVFAFLYDHIAENYDFQLRYKWEPNDVAIWDNRVVIHSATLDYWPSRRHALRVTPQGERPISVADHERTTGKRARDHQLDLWERQGIQQPERKDSLITRAYRD